MGSVSSSHLLESGLLVDKVGAFLLQYEYGDTRCRPKPNQIRHAKRTLLSTIKIHHFAWLRIHQFSSPRSQKQSGGDFKKGAGFTDLKANPLLIDILFASTDKR